MKKLLGLILVLLAVGALIFFMRNTSSFKPNSGGTPNATFKPDPSSATFMIEDESVTLSDGHNISKISAAETNLLEKIAYGDLNSDSKDDAGVFLSNSGGGSGTFIYLAAYVSGPVNYKSTPTIFLGDRISPQSISIQNGVLTVKYLDRRDDEPFAAEPTIPITRTFRLNNGELQER